MAFKLLDGVTAKGASRTVRIRKGVLNHSISVEFESRAATKITALTVKFQGCLENPGNYAKTGIIDNPVLAVGSTAERVANDTFEYMIDYTSYTKAAVAAGSVFSAAHVVTALKYGVVLIYVNTSGGISSAVPLATQAYTSAELAHVAGDAMLTPVDLCYIGRILINADAGTWNANTEDMTNGSDLTTATFLSDTNPLRCLATHALDADDITAQRALFHVSNKYIKHARVFVSALTGTGTINVRYAPSEPI